MPCLGAHVESFPLVAPPAEEGEVGCHLNSSKALPKNQMKTTKTNNMTIIHDFQPLRF